MYVGEWISGCVTQQRVSCPATRAFIGAAECEAVKVGPTSEIEFKVQFERSGGCWQNLDLLGRGPSVRGAARGGDTPGKAGRGPLDVRAVAKFQTF